MGFLTRAAASILPPLGILVGLILFWLLALQLIGVPRYVIPGPVEVTDAWIADPGSYAMALGQTLVDAGLGLVGGMVLGFLLAVTTTEFGDSIWLDTSRTGGTGDCRVVLMSHETGEEQREWSSVEEFLEEMLTSTANQ